MPETNLPPFFEKLAKNNPAVFEAFNNLGRAVADDGPLDAKTQRLVKLALATGAKLEGAVHSHTRRGLEADITPGELRHVALLAITTLGWPSAMAALSWIEDGLEA